MIFDQNCDFPDFLEILSQSFESHLFIITTLKRVVFGTKNAANFLTVN